MADATRVAASSWPSDSSTYVSSLRRASITEVQYPQSQERSIPNLLQSTAVRFHLEIYRQYLDAAINSAEMAERVTSPELQRRFVNCFRSFWFKSDPPRVT